MRLVSRIPAAHGRVTSITVRVIYDGTATSVPVEVTDVQLQPGEASGVVPHPSDVSIAATDMQYRNGVIPRPVSEVIVLANSDIATPTLVTVAPSRPTNVEVGAYRFGRISTPQWADGARNAATTGQGRTPVITERCDGYTDVQAEAPLHITFGWANRI